MCFSATASFSVAAVTGVIGVVAVHHVKHLPEVPLAVVPLLFACQQAIEGVLWLQLSADIDSGSVRILSLGFLMFALVLWPAYAALAVLLVEPDRRRRRILSIIAGLGFLLSAHLLWGLLSDPPDVSVQGHSIRYASDVAALS